MENNDLELIQNVLCFLWPKIPSASKALENQESPRFLSNQKTGDEISN